MAILLLKLMSSPPPPSEDWDGSVLDERHVGLIESARGEAVLYVRNFYKSEDLFLDMFEDEYREMKVIYDVAGYVRVRPSVLFKNNQKMRL